MRIMDLNIEALVVRLVFFAVLVILFMAWQRFRAPPFPLPPSPRGELLLGHVRLVPTHHPEVYYQNLAKELDTDILFFKQFRTPVVVLNTAKAADEILSKRGANYCDRPRFVMFEVMGWERTLTFLPWGNRFKAHRAHLQTSFTPSNVVQYQGLQEYEARQAVWSLNQRPRNWETPIRRFASAIVLKVAFGLNLEGNDDPYIKIAFDVAEAIGNGGSAGSTVVDYFPILRHFPHWISPSTALRRARRWSWAIKRLHDTPFAAAKRDFDFGIANQSYVYPLFEKHAKNISEKLPIEFSLADIKGSAGAIFAAGSDTTHASIMVVILNLLLNPRVVHKARALLDEAIGTDRLPSLKDRNNPRLRYLEFIVQETLRWRPLSPVGVPHKSLQDDIYNGMFIPRGTEVYFNTWAMSRDESVYKNPDSFNPDRYISVEDGGDGEPFLNGPFGFGRRICVGRHLALASVWIVLATLIATTDISKALDPEGKEIEPIIEFTTGLAR
ncbi:hypothetical protein ACMFMG_010230 [Clarireedia jacksonii]